jgi:ornithine cyclodeaminase/alanine dehydrogenase-like protein (mu-crystallin family)
VLTITSEVLRKLISMPEAIDAIREGFISLANGDVDQPSRLATSSGNVLAMLADVHDSGTVAKLVSVRPHNRDHGMPTVQTIVIWFTPATGEPTAIIEGEALTSMRTAAASGVATDLLAKEDARVLTMIGAGALAADQIRAIASVRPIREVRIFSLHEDHSAQLGKSLEIELPNVSFRAARTSAAALRDTDVVCAATTATSPVFDDGELPGICHINAVGAFRKTMCEIPAQTLARSKVLEVDQIAAALAESGDIIQALDNGLISSTKLAEIGELLQRRQVLGDSVSVFKSVGVAVQDWALAGLAVQRMRSALAPS